MLEDDNTSATRADRSSMLTMSLLTTAAMRFSSCAWAPMATQVNTTSDSNSLMVGQRSRQVRGQTSPVTEHTPVGGAFPTIGAFRLSPGRRQFCPDFAQILEHERDQKADAGMNVAELYAGLLETGGDREAIVAVRQVDARIDRVAALADIARVVDTDRPVLRKRGVHRDADLIADLQR